MTNYIVNYSVPHVDKYKTAALCVCVCVLPSHTESVLLSPVQWDLRH